MNYTPFQNFILRTPLLPFSFLTEFLCSENVDEISLKKFCERKEIQEAIFLASPNLYDKINKWLKNKLTDKKELERLPFSVYKYLARMASRSTPFGLFAGISVGKITDRTRLELPLLEEYRRVTRLDMNYLCALAADLSKMPEVQNTLKYYPNTSIYKLGGQLRYVEYIYIKSKRNHNIVSVDDSEYLQAVLSAAKKGAYANELAQLLVDEEISFDEAREFIGELIDSQLLVSELDPGVTGKDLLSTLLDFLKQVKNINDLKQILSKVKNRLSLIDKQNPGIELTHYQEISEQLEKLNTDFEPKFLFQTDMIKPADNLQIDTETVRQIQEGISVLDKLSIQPAETNLSKFRDAFYKRYEDEEIPLLNALDTESGIGYLQNTGTGDLSPLIDDIALPQSINNSFKIEWNPVSSFLLKKYINAIKENKYEVNITDSEIEKFISVGTDTQNLPVTISSMVQLFDSQDGTKILMSAAGGSGAANLLGRFCHTDNNILKHVEQITTKEEAFYHDKIIAEIVHLPESRTGNILHRPVLRKYEIPYLAKSSVKQNYQIIPEDLMISVRQNRIVLRSKSLNKEIIPRLSTAHNFSFNALPVYQFLCDLQTQDIKAGVGFSWGPLSNEYEFLPRVTYKNIIFSLASWNITKEDFKEIVKIKKDDELMKSVSKWRKKLNMPAWLALEDGDNELVLHLDNLLSIKTLISLVKKRSQFKLSEVLYNEHNLLVRNKEGGFTNEFIFSFYREN